MRLRLAAVTLAITLVCPAVMADGAVEHPADEGASSTDMHMEEPMHGEMKKKRMTKGDVKKSAEEKSEVLDKMLESEEKSMPPMPEEPHSGP